MECIERGKGALKDDSDKKVFSTKTTTTTRERVRNLIKFCASDIRKYGNEAIYQASPPSYPHNTCLPAYLLFINTSLTNKLSSSSSSSSQSETYVNQHSTLTSSDLMERTRCIIYSRFESCSQQRGRFHKHILKGS